MKITEVFNVRIAREREVIEQCYNEVLEDVSGDVDHTKEYIVKTLKNKGFITISIDGGVVCN